MNEKLYDVLKTIGRLVLPLGTFIAAVCQIWGLPWGDKITATLAAVAALLNAMLGVFSVSYWQEHEIREIPDITEDDHGPDA